MEAGVIGDKDEWATPWSTLVAQTHLGQSILWRIQRGSACGYIFFIIITIDNLDKIYGNLFDNG